MLFIVRFESINPEKIKNCCSERLESGFLYSLPDAYQQAVGHRGLFKRWACGKRKF
ncbi:hypothetical protein [Estrella lausannensis]|uniref:Uncharacterized protein n=1 Tax=Estrella lausannensis TaxID=483423 RepID=A0A0H5E712_9BACT|nr:hypothetical protein [Estrella lausannensis]CRX39085.1 hypothetical protein ELAC_1758 [Estrella lausannensis]